jgi:hypothetical protein
MFLVSRFQSVDAACWFLACLHSSTLHEEHSQRSKRQAEILPTPCFMCSFLDLLFNHEDGGNAFLRNVDGLLANYARTVLFIFTILACSQSIHIDMTDQCGPTFHFLGFGMVFIDGRSARRKVSTYTGQHKHSKMADLHPRPAWYSNLWSQCSSGGRHYAPYTAGQL